MINHVPSGVVQTVFDVHDLAPTSCPQALPLCILVLNGELITSSVVFSKSSIAPYMA